MYVKPLSARCARWLYCPGGLQPTVHVPLNVLTLPSLCSLRYGPQSVTLQPNDRNDTANVTFTALHSANNLTVNWTEADSIRPSCFNENNTTQALIAEYMMLKHATNKPVNYDCLHRNHESTITMKVKCFIFSKHIPTHKPSQCSDLSSCFIPTSKLLQEYQLFNE